MELMEHVNFSEKVADWEMISNDFVLRLGSKFRVEKFIKSMNVAKVKTERKMRLELD